MTLLMKESPYNLFKSLEGIYLLDKADVGYGKDLLDDLIVPIDKLKYNRLIYDKNKDNDFYMKIGDNHKVVNNSLEISTAIATSLPVAIITPSKRNFSLRIM